MFYRSILVLLSQEDLNAFLCLDLFILKVNEILQTLEYFGDLLELEREIILLLKLIHLCIIEKIDSCFVEDLWVVSLVDIAVPNADVVSVVLVVNKAYYYEKYFVLIR